MRIMQAIISVKILMNCPYESHTSRLLKILCPSAECDKRVAINEIIRLTLIRKYFLESDILKKVVSNKNPIAAIIRIISGMKYMID